MEGMLSVLSIYDPFNNTYHILSCVDDILPIIYKQFKIVQSSFLLILAKNVIGASPLLENPSEHVGILLNSNDGVYMCTEERFLLPGMGQTTPNTHPGQDQHPPTTPMLTPYTQWGPVHGTMAPHRRSQSMLLLPLLSPVSSLQLQCLQDTNCLHIIHCISAAHAAVSPPQICTVLQLVSQHIPSLVSSVCISQPKQQDSR